MNYDFVVEVNEEYGNLGFRALFMEGAEPLPAMTAAHDIMEHFPNVDLNSDSEALALGAMLYIRGESNYFYDSPYSLGPGYAISGDIMRLEYDSYKWGEITDPGRTTRLEDYVEEWIDEGIRIATKELVYESGMKIHNNWGKWVRGWLRKGYRKARKRYSLDPHSLLSSFEKIESSLNYYQKHSYLEVGSIVRIKYIRKTGDVESYVI